LRVVLKFAIIQGSPDLFRRKLNIDFALGVMTMAGQVAYETSEDFQK
jgi:hypothetical protein